MKGVIEGVLTVTNDKFRPFRASGKTNENVGRLIVPRGGYLQEVSYHTLDPWNRLNGKTENSA